MISHGVPVGFKIEEEKSAFAAAQEIYTPQIDGHAVVQNDQNPTPPGSIPPS